MEVGFLIIDVLSKMKVVAFWSIEIASMAVDVSSWTIEVGSCVVEVAYCIICVSSMIIAASSVRVLDVGRRIFVIFVSPVNSQLVKEQSYGLLASMQLY